MVTGFEKSPRCECGPVCVSTPPPWAIKLQLLHKKRRAKLAVMMMPPGTEHPQPRVGVPMPGMFPAPGSEDAVPSAELRESQRAPGSRLWLTPWGKGLLGGLGGWTHLPVLLWFG